MLGRSSTSPAGSSSSGSGSKWRGKNGDDLADLQAWRARYVPAFAATTDAATASAGGVGVGSGDIGDDGIIDVDADETHITKIRTPTHTSQPLLGFNVLALQRYVLMCAQNMRGGGMIDKPGKSRVLRLLFSVVILDVICVSLVPILTLSSFFSSTRTYTRMYNLFCRQEPRLLPHVLLAVRPRRVADLPCATHGS